LHSPIHDDEGKGDAEWNAFHPAFIGCMVSDIYKWF
jgi:hypothetical protein